MGLEGAGGYASLTGAMAKFNKVRLLQSDGGSEFEKEFKEKVNQFLQFYNNERPHLGLGMKIPNDVAVCRI